MAPAWETEDEYAMAAQATLPTPMDTPYRTPSRNSRRSSRRKSKSPEASSSPPRGRNGEMIGQRNSRDVTNDETISILDPRRFTPTLHANLVSEILSLRRDQEEKTKLIENLESSLHASRDETENIATTLSANAKETRSLKRQLALLEGGTSSALGELARERDEAVDTLTETRKRLEVAQKKARTQEEDTDRVHGLWSRDKDTWDEEKRKYERKIHVAEGRLKTVLDEVAAYQAAHLQAHESNADGEPEELTHDTGHGSDTASIRTMSMTNSIRHSMLNGPNGYGGSKLNGVSLADELDLDTEEEETQTEPDGRESVMSLSTLHKRTHSRESVLSRSHKRNQSIESLMRPGSVARGRLLGNQSVVDRLEGGIMEDDETPRPETVQYVTTGVQFSPPPSPVLKAVQEPEALVAEKQVKLNGGSEEIEANQRRKRVHASPRLIMEPLDIPEPMVSAASQTLDDPLSPPRTPKSPSRAPPLPPVSVPAIAEMSTASTQTDFAQPPSPTREAPKPPVLIPSISIHPPTSRPATPREPLLPQYVKDAACQVSMQDPVPSRSVAVQTEEIRVDQRLLPRHLQPSAISSSPPSPEPSIHEHEREESTAGPAAVPPPRNPMRMNSQHSQRSQGSIGDIPSSPPQHIVQQVYDAYPGNNDDGPLSKEKGPLRRPHRISSLFAGFDNLSSDDAEDFADGDLSDSDFRTALSAPKPKSNANRIGKRTSVAPTSVPEDVEPMEETQPRQERFVTRNTANYDSNGSFKLADAPSLPFQRTQDRASKQLDKPGNAPTTVKQGAMRKAALISNGIAAHQGRSRSPSLPEAVKEPPFPIPTRASSRKPPFSVSAPSDGNRSPTPRGGDSWAHIRRGSGRNHHRVNSIRKVRSAAALPGNGQKYKRRGSRSPPPLSASTEAPESPQLPPMPNNEITSPRFPNGEVQAMSRYATHRQQPSTNTANTANTSNTGGQSIGSTGQATSVVDAIAQTMVGEWMFKYVRRRKSFGVSEATAFEGDPASNGVRHKRWVWLAPYERAVMWSSKQPTSGSALMGKSGRKLTIQSVLDVKDENPSPKGIAPLFNRSILILTPARALKFTAPNRDRHYVWLTALSFLAHSSQAVPEIISPIPPLPQLHQLPEFDLGKPGLLRKHQIRDSIRIAKSKGSVATRSGPPSQQGGELSIRTDTSTMNDRSLRGTSSHQGSFYTANEPLPEAADPPVVPRFVDRPYPGSHGRKRSNTGSRIPPPLSFRGFSDRGPPPTQMTSSHNGGGGSTFTSSVAPSYGHAPASSTAGMSVGTNGSSDIYNHSQTSQSQRSSSYGVGGWGGIGGPTSVSGISSIRTSDASARPGAVVNNFFDAVGTVRMEAFISPITRFDDFPEEVEEGQYGGVKRRSRDYSVGSGARRRSREGVRVGNDGRRRRSRNRERDSYGATRRTADDWYSGSKTAGEEEYGLGLQGHHGRERENDPFRGF